MKPPFTDAELDVWDLSIIRSPYQYGQCSHGHGIPLTGNHLAIVRKKFSGWYIRHHCWSPCYACRGIPYRSPDIPMPCERYIDLKIPDEPTQHLWAPYPQHTSTQWRDNADLLPRTDGVYTSNISNNKELFKAREMRDQCLVFTPEGDVIDFRIEHDGYEKETFQEKASSIVPRFRAERLGMGPGAAWRGLYEVTDTSLTCSLTAIAATPYTFTGNLQGDVTTLKLKRTAGKEKAKLEYKFWPLTRQPQGQPAPAGGQAVDAPLGQPAMPRADAQPSAPAPPRQEMSAAGLFEVLSQSAAQIPYANRPIKGSIKTFADAHYIRRGERVIGICDLHFTYLSTFLFVVTNERLYLSQGSIGGKYWKDLSAQMPAEFNVDGKTFCIPLAQVKECAIKDGTFGLKIADAPVVEFSAYDAKAYASLIQRFMWSARNNS